MSPSPLVTDFDPLDPAAYNGDHHAAFARLRSEQPVAWHAAADMWLVTRHLDVMAVSRDPATFCSGGGVIPTDRGREVAAADSIIYLDPPEHFRHRKLVSPAFTPRRINDLEPMIRALAGELLDGIEPGVPVDFVPTVAEPLPLLVIAEMLGIPGADRDRFKVWSDATIAAVNDFNDDALAHALELWEYFRAVLDARQNEPRDDLLSVLVTAEVDEEPLKTDELLGFCMTLLVAGNETTRNLISGGVRALSDHPDQMARLVADPTGVPHAVEEMLRWVTPVMCFARTATRDTELGGQTIREGEYVLMLYPSANRDEDVFGPTADRFDATRDPNPHVGFGFGEHFCLGAALARLEARVLFDELLARFGSVSPAGDPERLSSILMNGLVHLPVEFGTRSGVAQM